MLRRHYKSVFFLNFLRGKLKERTAWAYSSKWDSVSASQPDPSPARTSDSD